MKKRKFLLIILGVLIIGRIALHQFCKMIDKGFTSYSSTLIESKSNNFFLDNYFLTEIKENENFESNKEFNFNSIFVENNWDHECSIIRIDKVPTKTIGYNIVLPMKVNNLESFDKYRFYLAIEKDTIGLRGNRTMETAYYNKSWDTYRELSNSILLIKERKGKLVYKFKLKKEKYIAQ